MEPSRSTLAAGIDALYEAAFRTGDFDPAEMLLRDAHSRALDEDDRLTEAAALDRLGMLTHFRALGRGSGDVDAASEMDLFEQALATRRKIGDNAGIAESLFGIGLAHQVHRGDWDTAMPIFREAQALAEEHADDLTKSEIQRHIGFYYAVREVQPALAVEYLRTSLELRISFGDERWIPSGTLALGQAELSAGMLTDAIEHLQLAKSQAQAAQLRGHSIDQADEWLRRAQDAQQRRTQAAR